MKYVSIDIETTGLEPDHHDIVEIGAFVDDLSMPYEDMHQKAEFRCIVIDPDNTYNLTPYCATLHAPLWPVIEEAHSLLMGEWDDDEKLVDGGFIQGKVGLATSGCMYHYDRNVYYATPETAAFAFNEWLLGDAQYEKGQKVIAAGKNVANFDLPFLNHPAYNFGATVPWDFRSLDPGGLYWQPGDTNLPSLRKCLERAGMEPTALHTSLGDAWDVIRVLRHRLLAPQGQRA